MWESIIAAAAAHAEYYKLRENMAKNWRVLKNNKIQTFEEEVWLFDSEGDVVIPFTVPSRPWTNIDASFTHWMPKTNDVEPEVPVISAAVIEALALDAFKSYPIIFP